MCLVRTDSRLTVHDSDCYSDFLLTRRAACSAFYTAVPHMSSDPAADLCSKQRLHLVRRHHIAQQEQREELYKMRRILSAWVFYVSNRNDSCAILALGAQIVVGANQAFVPKAVKVVLAASIARYSIMVLSVIVEIHGKIG